MLLDPKNLTEQAINDVLKEAGILGTSDGDVGSVEDLLDTTGLGKRDIIRLLHNVIYNSESEAIKFQAIKAVMEMRRMLKPEENSGPSYTVVIRDPKAAEILATGHGLNPILLPREAQLLNASAKPTETT